MGILPEVSIVSIYPCVIPVEAYTRGVGAGRTILKQTPHSLDREDDQDFVIRCRTYSKRARIESVYQYRLFDPSSWNWNKFGSGSRNLGDLLYLMNGESSLKSSARNPADKVRENKKRLPIRRIVCARNLGRDRIGINLVTGKAA